MAFPLLASGNNRFDLGLALEIAIQSIDSFDPVNKLEQVYPHRHILPTILPPHQTPRSLFRPDIFRLSPGYLRFTRGLQLQFFY